jgi:hypothetical protein
VIVIDDSPSMNASGGSRVPIEQVRQDVMAFLRDISRERPGDSVTLLVASQPRQPIVNGRFVNERSEEELMLAVERIEASDREARYEECLRQIEEQKDKTALNRRVYVLSDLMARDWRAPLSAEETGLFDRIAALGDAGIPVMLVDAGERVGGNVGVRDVTVSEPVIAKGVAVRYRAVVKNFSDEEVRDVTVSFAAGTASRQAKTIDRIGAQEEESATFAFTALDAGPLPIAVTLPPDSLLNDNTRYFAANVQPGLRVLVVDDEYAPDTFSAPSAFLNLALAPPGTAASGVLVETVTGNEFETRELAPYRVVVLAAAYRVSEERAAGLAAWVREGGGLVAFLGREIDPDSYNEFLYAEGEGVLPCRVTTARPRGDPDKREWVNLAVDAPNHPVAQVFAGANNPFLQRVKVFRWWPLAVGAADAGADDAGTAVLAHLTNPEQTPFFCEKRFGEGRVFVVGTSPDDRWSNWPADASYVVTVLEMVRHAGRPKVADTTLPLAAPIRLTVDPARHGLDVTVQPPAPRSAALTRAMPEGVAMQAVYNETFTRGFYELTLASQTDSGDERIVYAFNTDGEEGDLRRVAKDYFKRSVAKAGATLANRLSSSSTAAEQVRQEFWRLILVVLLLTLGAEQALAWLFGARR